MTRSTRQIALFRNGRNQAIRIPREFELAGVTASIRKEGNRLIIEAIPEKNRLISLLESLQPLDEELPVIEDFLVQDQDIFT